MLERRSESLAAVWSFRSQVRYVARGNGFPYVPLNTGARLPQTTQAFRAVTGGTHGFTGFVETHPHAWTRNADIGMFEQTRLAPNGHAVTLLWAELPQEDRDEDGSPPELGLPRFR